MKGWKHITQTIGLFHYFLGIHDDIDLIKKIFLAYLKCTDFKESCLRVFLTIFWKRTKKTPLLTRLRVNNFGKNIHRIAICNIAKDTIYTKFTDLQEYCLEQSRLKKYYGDIFKKEPKRSLCRLAESSYCYLLYCQRRYIPKIAGVRGILFRKFSKLWKRGESPPLLMLLCIVKFQNADTYVFLF